MIRLLTIAMALGLFAVTALAGSVRGKIQVVNPHTHPGLNGVMIQMSERKIVDATCGNSSWAKIKVESDLDNALVSVALVAQTTQQTVTVYTSECSVPPETLTAYPIVQTIDLGVRD